MGSIPPVNNNAPIFPLFSNEYKERSFVVHGLKLLNVIPEDFRKYAGEAEGFHSKLDKFLATVPNKPALFHYVQSVTGNSLLKHLVQQRTECN